jgi:hypothetical protein
MIKYLYPKICQNLFPYKPKPIRPHLHIDMETKSFRRYKNSKIIIFSMTERSINSISKPHNSRYIRKAVFQDIIS